MSQKGLNSTVMYPMPALESSQKKRAFELIQFIAGTGQYQVDTQNSVYTIAPAEGVLPAPVINMPFGQSFLYSWYQLGGINRRDL
jgi:hypothetical protein